MRILYLTPGCFDKGGISRYSRYEIRAWREIWSPREVTIVSILGPDESSFEDEFHVDWFAGGIGRLDKARLLARTADIALRTRPRLIHAAHVNLSGFARVLARITGARTLVNVYGLDVWSGLRPDAAWGLRTSDRLISDCHFTAQYLAQQGLRSPSATTVIWDCVDLERFSPGEPKPGITAKYGIPDPSRNIVLMTLGRISKNALHKGYERLFDAFKQIAWQQPTLQLVYAGRGDLVRDLEARAAANGLADRVHFTGAVHEDDLADVYRCAHIFSLVSDRGVARGEGIPLTPLEAAACGVPIVVGNQDGSQEAVEQGKNGYVIDPFDRGAHARVISELASDSELRGSMGGAARSRAVAEFGFESFRQKHYALLRAWLPHATVPVPADDPAAGWAASRRS